MAACEGLLVVDAAQGVEAQSVVNCYTAIEQDLEVLPVLNKIDLPQAEPERTGKLKSLALIRLTRLRPREEWVGIADLLDKVVDVIPAPVTDETNLCKP